MEIDILSMASLTCWQRRTQRAFSLAVEYFFFNPSQQTILGRENADL
jgi:hypothetical protein